MAKPGSTASTAFPAWLREAERPRVSASSRGETAWMRAVFCHSLLVAGKPLHSGLFAGHLKVAVAVVEERIGALGGVLLHQATGFAFDQEDHGHTPYDPDMDELEFQPSRGRNSGTLEYGWPDTLASLDCRDGATTLHVWSGSKERVHALASLARECLDRRPAGSVYALVERHGMLDTERLASVTAPLARDNYTPEVLSAFDHVLQDMAARSPCGRLVLVDGAPGVGKTHLVRGLIQAVPGAMFLIIPSANAERLSGPDLLPVLMTSTRARGTEPLVLVIEDADNCLVPRQSDNVNAISTILNISDGVIGAAMNLWVVATTNARHKEVDPAIVRPGRLCRRIAVEALAPQHAARVHERIAGTERVFERPATLAEIYATARLLAP